ncbi:MAG TPA: APC family permease [Acidimicrobiales bacterium]|nr:APC family permease [Acidimicrobiales bacterium]
MTEGMTPESLGAKVQVVPGEHERLHQGVLGLVDIAAATMANIAPAMSFYFGFAFFALTTGVATPVVLIVAGVAIALLGNTLSEFTKVTPSTGGFITFVGKTFGARTAVTTALLTGAGYIAAMASVIAISGGFFEHLWQYYGVKGLGSVPWLVWTAIFLAFGAFMMVRGVKLSTKVAGAFFAFEFAVLVVVSVASLIKFHGSLSASPFNPGKITNGFHGLATAFPLAIYLFIGWENSAALAEETSDPRRNVPKAVFTSIGLMLVSYVLFAYASVTGFKNNVGALSASPVPFLSVAHSVLAFLAFLGFVAGMTSTVGSLIAGTNSQARLIFNAGREGLLPKFIGKVHDTRRTPVNALLFFLGVSASLILGWVFVDTLSSHTVAGWTAALNFFFESSTFGTILVLIVYALSNLALPFYMSRNHPSDFRVIRHAVLPIIGTLWILVPLYYLARPSPSVAPYNWYPYAALAFLFLSVVYSMWLVARDPGIGDRVGSIVADE